MQTLIRTTTAMVAAVTIVLGALACGSPAHADAKSGTCAKGYKLGSYAYTYKARNHTNDVMFTISWKKRWCYSTSRHRIGSVYDPKPSVKIYGSFDNSWKYKGISDEDHYYSNRDPRGKRHPRHPRWSHVTYHSVKMNHCLLKWTGCSTTHYIGGIVVYRDGSKKVYKP